jgi:hypothetical protein
MELRGWIDGWAGWDEREKVGRMIDGSSTNIQDRRLFPPLLCSQLLYVTPLSVPAQRQRDEKGVDPVEGSVSLFPCFFLLYIISYARRWGMGGGYCLFVEHGMAW